MNELRLFKNMIQDDECYTKRVEADKLVKYLVASEVRKDTIIWLPFDTIFSNIYLSLKESGYNNLILSSLATNQDFYFYEPTQWDMIISNPPFANRTRLLERLLSFNKPFIILQATQFFNNQYGVAMLYNFSNDITFLLPRTRMGFMKYDAEVNKIKSVKYGASFYSFWIAYKCNFQQAFIHLEDLGTENVIEELEVQGNRIEDSYYDLFNLVGDSVD